MGMSPDGGIAAPVSPNKLRAGRVVNLFESQVFLFESQVFAFCSVCQSQKLHGGSALLFSSALLRLRQNAIFRSGVNVICPVQSSIQKYFA